MKKLVILPLIATVALGLSACAKHEETSNVTVNETANVVDTTASDNSVSETTNASNAADALTNG